VDGTAKKEEHPTPFMNRKWHLKPPHTRADLEDHQGHIQNSQKQNDRNTAYSHLGSSCHGRVGWMLALPACGGQVSGKGD
jgi:hypothetical protein